jgi:CheY-like chemotaxis protein
MSIVKNIFLVDDDTDDQQFFVEAISGLKNISLSGVANNGSEALNVLNNSTLLPDFIFLDFNMPFMNGMQFLCEIKKFPRTKI